MEDSEENIRVYIGAERVFYKSLTLLQPVAMCALVKLDI